MADPEAPRAKGEPLVRSETDLTRVAPVSPDDIDRARMYWRDHTLPRFRNLLDAEAD